MIKGTPGVGEELEIKLIHAGSYIFYLTYLYYWWKIFNGDEVTDIKSITTMNFQIGLQMVTLTIIIIFPIMFVILFLGNKYNSNVHEAQLLYLRTSGIEDVQLLEPSMFLPKYLFYFIIFTFAFISAIIITFFVSILIVKGFDKKRINSDKQYIYVCSKLLMIINLILFILIFEFLKPSTKIYYE